MFCLTFYVCTSAGSNMSEVTLWNGRIEDPPSTWGAWIAAYFLVMGILAHLVACCHLSEYCAKTRRGSFQRLTSPSSSSKGIPRPVAREVQTSGMAESAIARMVWRRRPHTILEEQDEDVLVVKDLTERNRLNLRSSVERNKP